MSAVRESVLPSVQMAPWQKRFWPEPGSAGSAAALSALPPQSPPDLHTHRHTGLKTCLCRQSYTGNKQIRFPPGNKVLNCTNNECVYKDMNNSFLIFGFWSILLM